MQIVMSAALVVISASAMLGQTLLPDDIAAAIAQGTAGKTLQKKCSARGENGVDFVVEGPIGRIMRAAGEAARRHRDFTAADLVMTPSLGGPTVTVVTRRDRTLSVPTPINDIKLYRQDLVLRSRSGGSKILQPVAPIEFNGDGSASRRVTFNDGGGQTHLPPTLPALPGWDMTASFDLDDFKALPPGDVDVVMFASDTGEHRCRISEKERRAIR